MRRRLWIGGLIISILFLQACRETAKLPTEGKLPQAFIQAKQQWESAGITHYSYKFRWLCECLDEYVQEVEIVVENQEIVHIRRVSDQTEIPELSYSWYYTISELFSYIEEEYAKHPEYGFFEFDPTLGYPIQVYIDYQERIADEELWFLIRDLVPEL